MCVASGCGEQEEGVASGNGWTIWVWLVGVVVWRYIYISSYYLSLLILYLFVFCSSIPTFFTFKNVFRSCSSTFCN